MEIIRKKEKRIMSLVTSLQNSPKNENSDLILPKISSKQIQIEEKEDNEYTFEFEQPTEEDPLFDEMPP